MNFFQDIWTDLREKRLWPFALALIAAIVAVPVVLAKSGAKEPATPAPTAQSNPNPAQVAGLPIISAETATGPSSLKGVSNRDPFKQQKNTQTTTTPGSTTTPANGGSTIGAPGTSSSTGSPSGGSGVPVVPGGGTTTPPTTPTTPTLTPTPTFAGLTDTEAYHVTVALSDANGGFNTIDPLPRLSLMPSAKQPLLIELGVLRGGNRVLFVLQPGTVVSGAGVCTPGPIDCQILSVPTNKTEQLSTRNVAGVVTPVTSFTVTAITKDEYKTAAAADKARRTVNSAGQDLLSRSSLNALSLFQYQPSLGAVVDLRNLTVGGS